MKQTVQATWLSDAIGFLKGIANSFDKWFNSIESEGVQSHPDNEKVLKSDKWPKILKFKSVRPSNSGDSQTFYWMAKCEKLDDDNYKDDLYVKLFLSPAYSNPNKQPRWVERANAIKYDDVLEYLKKCVAEAGYIDGDIEIESSAEISVKLARVCGSTEDSIELLAISAACSPVYALELLNTAVKNDEFVSLLTEEPQSFAIVDEGEELDIQPIAEVDTSTIYKQFAQAAYNLLFDIQCVHWNARGEGFDTLHNLCSDYIYRAMHQVDAFAELHVASAGYINSPKQFICELSTPDCTNGFTLSEGLNLIESKIREYVDFVECFICNCPADIQSNVMMWIRDWKHQIDYVIKQTLK